MGLRLRRLFNDMWRSASDLHFYAEVARMPFGPAFAHLLRVSLAAGTVFSLLMILNVYFLNGFMRWCQENMPVVEVRGGEASSDVPQPYIIERTAGSGEKAAVIIDTTGAVARVGGEYMIGALIRKDGITVKARDAELSWSYPKGAAFTIDRRFFGRFIISAWMIPLIAGSIYMAVLLILFAQAAAVALLGEGVAALRGIRYSYREVLQMSFYAVSLAMCVMLILTFLGIVLSPGYSIAVYAFIHLTFLVAAVMTAEGDERAA